MSEGGHPRTLAHGGGAHRARALPGEVVHVEPEFAPLTPRLLSTLETEICQTAFELCFQLQPAPLQQGGVHRARGRVRV